jgi:hypothetical protein
MKTNQYLTFADVPDARYRINNQSRSVFGNPSILILFGAVMLAATPITSSALTLPVIQDTTVDSARLKVNFGGSESLNIFRNGQSTQHAYAKFGLEALPLDAVITKATLRVFVNRVDAPVALTVNTVTQDWSERTLTQANATTLVPLPPPPLVVSETDKDHYVNYDITELVQGWQSHAKPNFGIAITPPAVGAPVKVALDSKENDDTSHPMEIEVAFEGPRGAKGDKGDTGLQGAVGLSGFAIIQVSDIIRSSFENGKLVMAICPAGKEAVGGGCGVSNPAFASVVSGFPTGNPSPRYSCNFNTSGINENVFAIANCANVQR